jgi:Flp pilus assembly CpaF family ATPase
MSFELILPFLRPIEALLLDENVSEIMGNPDASWWYERDGIMFQEPNISFDAGKLQTGLEVIANQLGKKLDEDNPLDCTHNSRTEVGWRQSSRRLCAVHLRSSSGNSPAAITQLMI